MKKAKIPFLVSISVVLATLACVATSPAPASAPPTFTPDLIAAGEAQTSTVAHSIINTATAIPDSPSPTITRTMYPTITPLPTATPTNTKTPFGFVASPTLDYTATAEWTPDPDEGATNDWGSDFRCSLLDKSPIDWAETGGAYQVYWTLLNSGHKTWQANETVVMYVTGAKVVHGHNKVFKLNKDVRPGQTIKVMVIIYPPDAPGKYRSVWGLYSSRLNNVFCTFTAKTTMK
jgi:hypothetical protein